MAVLEGLIDLGLKHIHLSARTHTVSHCGLLHQAEISEVLSPVLRGLCGKCICVALCHWGRMHVCVCVWVDGQGGQRWPARVALGACLNLRKLA